MTSHITKSPRGPGASFGYIFFLRYTHFVKKMGILQIGIFLFFEKMGILTMGIFSKFLKHGYMQMGIFFDKYIHFTCFFTIFGNCFTKIIFHSNMKILQMGIFFYFQKNGYIEMGIKWVHFVEIYPFLGNIQKKTMAWGGGLSLKIPSKKEKYLIHFTEFQKYLVCIFEIFLNTQLVFSMCQILFCVSPNINFLIKGLILDHFIFGSPLSHLLSVALHTFLKIMMCDMRMIP